MRKMDEATAKDNYEKKLTELENIGKTFTDPKNKEQITNIIAELKKSDNLNGISKTQADQK
jgi:hypothetical protein